MGIPIGLKYSMVIFKVKFIRKGYMYEVFYKGSFLLSMEFGIIFIESTYGRILDNVCPDNPGQTSIAINLGKVFGHD